MKPISLAIPSRNLGAVATIAPPVEDETRYPVAYISEYSGPELADEGTITFRYRIRRKTEEKRGDTELCSYDLELKEVLKADFEDETNVEESAVEAMHRRIKRR